MFAADMLARMAASWIGRLCSLRKVACWSSVFPRSEALVYPEDSIFTGDSEGCCYESVRYEEGS